MVQVGNCAVFTLAPINVRQSSSLWHQTSLLLPSSNVASQETIIKHCDSKGVLFCQRTGWNQIYRQALQLGGDPVDIVMPAWLLLSAPAVWFTLITKHFCIQSLNAWNFAARTKDKKKKLDISFPIMMTSLNQHICLLACGFYHSHRIFRDCHSSQKWMRQMALIQVLIVFGGHEHGVHGDGWHWQETGDGGHSFIHGYTWIFENCDAADLALGDQTCGIIQWLTFTPKQFKFVLSKLTKLGRCDR